MLDDAPDWLIKGMNHIWQPYCQMQTASIPLAVSSTSGVRIKLENDRELIDGIASWWTMCHGYNHPYLLKAVQEQLNVMPHIMFAGIAHQPGYQLAERLTKILPVGLERVFFADSGSVAIEVAMKIAVQYYRNLGNSNKTKFIAFKNGYHGDTMGAMSLALGNDIMHYAFSNYTPSQYECHLPKNTIELEQFDQLLAKIKNNVAAVVIEPLVQCAGGMKFHTAEMLHSIYKIAKNHDLLVIVDEVATGFARTGQMFACLEAKITPDIICIGKALSGGVMSLAATITTNQVFNNFLGPKLETALMHGPTFMANPLACAVACASLDLFEQEPRLEQVESIENQLKAELLPLVSVKNVKDVRIKGAIGVVELLENSMDMQSLRDKFLKENVFIRPFADVIYLMPAFTISPDDLTYLTDKIAKVLK